MTAPYHSAARHLKLVGLFMNMARHLRSCGRSYQKEVTCARCHMRLHRSAVKIEANPALRYACEEQAA